jgi:MFS transporter, DHA3 family, tetracycline resistance protein
VRRLGAYQTWLLYRGAGSFAMALGWTLAPVFFVRELHLSPLTLVLTGTALELGYFLFEVPTGIVADSYSRRLSIVIAQLVMGAGFVLTGVASGVGLVIAAAGLMGFGWTFKSGAEDAWLADEVGIENVGRPYQRGAQVGRICALAGIGVAVGLALLGPRLPVIAGGLAFVALGIVLALVMPETGFRPARREELTAWRSLARTGGDGLRLIRASPVLLLIVGITLFQGMSSEAIDRLWEAHFLTDVGVPSLLGLDAVVWFGLIAAASLVLSVALAQPLLSRLERLDRGGMARFLLALDVGLILAMVGFALAGAFAVALVAYLATGMARSLGGPVQAAWVNSNVESSRIRATVISMTNLGDSVGEWGGGPALGAIGNVFGIRAALVAGAVALSPALALFGRAIRHHGGEPKLEQPQPVPAATV